jgi:hypothetical protein
MVTINPNYQQRGVSNPYYTVSNEVTNKLRKLVGSGEILYRSVDGIKGNLVLDMGGKFPFLLERKKKSLNSYILLRKKDIKGHLGMATRKDSTASANVNEFLSMFFLVNRYSKDNLTVRLESDCHKFKNKSTKVLNPSSSGVAAVTYSDLAELIDRDETAERDIQIGYRNAIAVKKDISGNIKNTYWCPRGKPPGVSPKNPSDTVVQLSDNTYQGYSNKIAAGKDETPKFNTNLTAFFSKLEDSNQLKKCQQIIDDSWNQATKQIPKQQKLSAGAMNNFDIRKEPYSESASKKEFAKLSKVFTAEDSDFYGSGFYYLFRNQLIKNLGAHIIKPKNLIYFLNTIYFYTYDDPRSKFVPCPYKLLIGQENGASQIKDVSDNADLKNILLTKKTSDISGSKLLYDGKSQRMSIVFKWRRKTTVDIPITVRTRAAGGWSGKSLFVNTPGLKIS